MKRLERFGIMLFFIIILFLVTSFKVEAEENNSNSEMVSEDLFTEDISNEDDVIETFEDIITESDDNTKTEALDGTVEQDENEATHSSNEEIDVIQQCEIEGHKYDQSGNPLSEWQIGLMKIITQKENYDIWDLANDITDNNGYYCLEWDGETRVFRGDTPTITEQPYNFTYHVYEKLISGWSFLSIEKGNDVENLAVVGGDDIRFDGDYVSTQIGEVNGYIYANGAYHVDFYNKKSQDVPPSVVEEERHGGSGSSGTRVKNRNHNVNSNSDYNTLNKATSTATLLSGQQVTVVPTGAPDTGTGGTSNNNVLTINNILSIARRVI